MMLYEQQVQAGFPLQLNVPGRFFLLDSTGTESEVSVELLRGGSSIVGRVPGAKRGLKIGIEAGFDGVRIEAAGNTTVRFFAAFENVSISTTDGASVEIPNGVEITNPMGSPVPVVFTGSVELTAENVGINNSDVNALPVRNQALTTHVHVAAVAVGVAETAAVSDATLKRIIFRNNHDTAVIALGGVGVTLANAAIRLQPGGSYIEDQAAGAVWKAISDTAGAALQIQGMK